MLLFAAARARTSQLRVRRVHGPPYSNSALQAPFGAWSQIDALVRSSECRTTRLHRSYAARARGRKQIFTGNVLDVTRERRVRM